MLGPAADYLTQSYFAYFRVPFPGPHRVTAGTQNPFSAFCRSPLVTRDAALSHKDSVVRLLCFRKEQDLSWVVPDEGDNELKQRTMSAHLCITTYRAPDNEVLKLELCFVGQDCQRIPGILGATYGLQTKRLDLSFNAIKSVKGLDKFPYLEELILDNNCVDDSVTIPRLDTLHTLSLNKNKLSNLPKLVEQVKRQLPNLRYLSLLGNAACPDMLSPLHTREEDYAAYRLYVLQHLPRLRFLDSTAVRRSEVRQARRARMACVATITTVSTPRGTASSGTTSFKDGPSSAPSSPVPKSPAKASSVSWRCARPQTLGVKSSTSASSSPRAPRRRAGGAVTSSSWRDSRESLKLPTISVKTPSGSSVSLTPSLSPSTGEAKSATSSPATPHKNLPNSKASSPSSTLPPTPTPPPPPPSPSSVCLKGNDNGSETGSVGGGGEGGGGDDKPSGFLKVRKSWRSFFRSSSVVPPQA